MKKLFTIALTLISLQVLGQNDLKQTGELTVSGMATNVGNRAQSVFNYNFTHNIKYKKGDVNLSSNYTLSYQSKIKFQDDITFRIQPRVITRDWSLFTFSQYTRAYSRKLDSRLEAGFGGGHNIIKRDWFTLTGSYAILFDGSDYSDGSEIRAVRHSPRIQFFGKVKNFSFFTEAFYQPKISDLKSYNYRNTIEIKYSINDKLSLTSTYKRSYETYNIKNLNGLIENFTIGTTLSY
jgi:hypothetical protein